MLKTTGFQRKEKQTMSQESGEKSDNFSKGQRLKRPCKTVTWWVQEERTVRRDRQGALSDSGKEHSRCVAVNYKTGTAKCIRYDQSDSCCLQSS